MKPIKIIIEGAYLDCQIYRGRLYLWDFDGQLSVYDWGNLMASLMEFMLPLDDIAYRTAFVEGNLLYKTGIAKMLLDSDIRQILISKFKHIRKFKLVIDRSSLEKHLIGRMDTPSKEMPVDTEIYSNNLYFSTSRGVYCAKAHKLDGNPVSSKPRKLWDARVLSLKANKYPQIALSAGDDGLFELNMSNNPLRGLEVVDHSSTIYRISSSHSSFANYSRGSIYNSSLVDTSFLSVINYLKLDDGEFHREKGGIMNDNEIFKRNVKHLSWASEGLIMCAIDNDLEIVKIHSLKNLDFEERPTYKINKDIRHRRIIGGATSHFGSIIEFEDGLRIIQTDREIIEINEPVTRWRIYPRSRNYENQLHVLLDDHMEVYSFIHDYFLNQEEKYLGITYDEM